MSLLALDTDVLVHWASPELEHHQQIREFVSTQAASGQRLALVPQILYEMIHVTTDARRLTSPLKMEEAIRIARELWEASEVERLLPSASVLGRACDLLGQHKLGRKRILDTVLAATLEEARCERLATLNGRDFKIFPFLTVVDPTQKGPR